jgi:integrase
MSNRAKGPRLHLRPARGARQAHWVILDTGRPETSTGCGAHDTAGAEQALGRYLALKRLEDNNSKDPAKIPVADVIALYAAGPAQGHTLPGDTQRRLNTLLEFFGDYVLAQINGDLCRQYAQKCFSDAVARRELEDLRSAINYHRKEGKCDRIISVWLPERQPGRIRWLTRKEASGLIRAAWRYREVQKGLRTDRRSRQHVARFVLVGLYTGTRAGAICGASFHPTSDRGYVDVDRGVFYRRAADARVTKKRQTPVPLPPGLLAHLRRWKASGQTNVVEWNGKPVKRITKAFRNAVRELGLKDVTPHTLRHTAATWLMQRGVPLWQAAGYLGMTEKQLEDGYGHHHPDWLDEARGAFGRRA